MITRRRFLTISAAALAAPAGAATRWQGVALGAATSITLRGDDRLTGPLLADIREELVHIEALFSLYDPGSSLSRLNINGVLTDPHPDMLAVLGVCDALHRATDGVFDPTVQPLWQALAKGWDTRIARAKIGWDRISVSSDVIRLESGQSLTLNGIVQGWATDRIKARLRAAGLTDVLVNIGEFAAMGGPWSLGVANPEGRLLDQVTLRDRAIATSSPGAMRLGGGGHILSPADDLSLWNTVSVETESATLADGLSTACVFMDRQAAEQVARRLGIDAIFRLYA